MGYGLEEFRVPQTLLARPLKPHEVRLRGNDGRVYIVDTKSNQATPEVGPNIKLSELNIIISISDQGPLNVSSLNFLQYSKGAHMALCLWDPFHRAWNDIKTSAKRAGSWKTILELTCLFNINYGPFNSSQWWQRKRSLLEEFLASTTIHSEIWTKFEGLIAHERRVCQPTDDDDREELLRQMGAIQNIVIKGPLVKLMRWFSFFQCCTFWQHDFYATKMILETQGGFGDDDLQKDDDDDEAKDIQDHKNPKEQLAALKKRVGTFKLGPSLITPKNLALKDILLSVCKSTWNCHAQRAKKQKSPDHIMAMCIQNAQGGWKQELVGIVQSSLWEMDNMQHILPEWAHHTETLTWHMNFLEHLLHTRAMSICTANCLPPMKYSHVLSEDKQASAAATALAVRDFKALLAAESASHETVVKPLQAMAWTQSPFCRVVLMAHEEDHFSGTNHAKALHTVAARTLGDSRIIENIHQHGRDLQRSAKHDSFGDTKIFANVLRSGCLEEREVPICKAQNAEKVTQGSAFLTQPIAKKLTSRGHKLQGKLQEMMLPKNKDHGWPSPSPSTLYQSVCATEWVMKFFGPMKENQSCSINQAWLTTLARKG